MISFCRYGHRHQRPEYYHDDSHLHAGRIFVGVVGRSSANSVAYFHSLSLIPPQFAVAVLFIVSCLVSLAMGTSVGTITLIVPIGIAVAKASGFSVPLCIASVMSGAMFGDNLSFISIQPSLPATGRAVK